MSMPDGTPDGAPDDAVETAERGDGTQDGASADDKGTLIKTLQDNVARERREREEREQEIARLRSELEQTRPGVTPSTTGGAGALDGAEQAAQVYIASLRAAAQNPNDPSYHFANYEIKRTEALVAEQRRMSAEIALAAIPEAERAGVRKKLESGDFRTIQAAREAYLGSLTDEERAKLRPRPSREVAPREREEVVETGTRPLSAIGVQQRELKRGEWERAYDKASADGDTKRLEELRRSYPRN